MLKAGIVLLILVLWAAIHDIIKGGENLTSEYTAVIICAVLLPVLTYLLLRKYTQSKKK